MPSYSLPTFDLRCLFSGCALCAIQAVTYNAHIYLTALNAAKALAEAAGDTAALDEITKSYELSQAAIVDERLWNDTEKFFRCHTKDGGEGDNQIFTDSL